MFPEAIPYSLYSVQRWEPVKLSSCQAVKFDPWGMLNTFCFHVYAQSVSLSSCQVVKLSRCQVVKFDPWDMLNNFCFHVYAQKSLFIVENDWEPAL